MLVPDSLHTFEFCRQHLVLLAYNFGAKFQRKIQILMLVPGACHLSRSLPCIFLPLNDAELRSVKRQWPTPLRWFLIGQRSNLFTSYDSSRKSIWPRTVWTPNVVALIFFEMISECAKERERRLWPLNDYSGWWTTHGTTLLHLFLDQRSFSSFAGILASLENKVLHSPLEKRFFQILLSSSTAFFFCGGEGEGRSLVKPTAGQCRSSQPLTPS